VCGSGMGAFLFAPLCQWLLTVYDWKNALIILAGTLVLLYCIIVLNNYCYYLLGLILNCVVFGSLMRPLNIVVNSEEPDEIDLQKLKNTEPGVHSSLTINHLEPPLNAIQSAIQSEILTHKKTKMRSISDTKSPVLEELLSPVLHKTHIHSSQRSIFLPPMAKKDVFYSGSTLNLKSESNGNLSFVSNNNNIHSIDRKYSYKLSVTSDSICYEKRDVNKDHKKTDTNKETFGSILVQIFDLSVLKKPVMILLVVANVFGMTGYYIPFVYITQHVRNGIKGSVQLISLTS
jgi:MCP family monocarboxylic acid transporter-like MFS transporter 14